MSLTETIRFRTTKGMKKRAMRVARASKVAGKAKTASDLGRESFQEFIERREKELGIQTPESKAA